ncbi:hypothetical protein ACHAXT_003062 [Thalassiosira profunda]
MAGRKKRAKTSPPSAETKVAAVHPPTSSPPTMLATPIGTLLRMEATLWMKAKGGGRLPLSDFYALARAHGWLGVHPTTASPDDGGDDTEAPENAPREVSELSFELSSEVHALVGHLSERERLLFDFVAASGWQSTEAPHLYPLYRITAASSGKAQLEVLQAPQDEDAKPAAAPAKTRSDVLSSMYQLSRKQVSPRSSVGGDETFAQTWWEHAKGVAEAIIADRKATASSTGKVEGAAAGKAAVKSILSNGDNGDHASPVKSTDEGKKMSLEERVRARSLRSEAIAKSKQSSGANGPSSQASEGKTLLELADALRSYSQRRGLASSGGGGSALDRLKSRASGGSDAPTNIARLAVADLLKDARTSWKTIVHESLDQGSGPQRAGSAKVVSIDLSRVLFQLRLQMVADANGLEKRQMEAQLLGLLEKLAATVPKWIHLRKAPLAAAAMGKPKPTSKQNATSSSKKPSIRQSTIVIRNDAVDFKEVRAQLGGRVHNPVGAGGKSSDGGKEAVSKGTKRSRQEASKSTSDLQGSLQAPVSAADAIVPPSFARMYGKALDKE